MQSNDIYLVCERWTRGKRLSLCMREAAQLRPDQLTQLLALRDRECVVLDGLAYYRGEELPPMPAGYVLASPPPVTAWRMVLVAVLLVILAVLWRPRDAAPGK